MQSIADILALGQKEAFMAGELIGKICEAVVDLAITKTGISHYAWGYKPQNMSIVSDFIIGKNKDYPAAIILVTHSLSAMQTHKKFWRNMDLMLTMPEKQEKS